MECHVVWLVINQCFNGTCPLYLQGRLSKLKVAFLKNIDTVSPNYKALYPTTYSLKIQCRRNLGP
jgi:hypothetical protein